MMRVPALCALFVAVASCQTYDFERVVPLAVAQTTDKQVVASKRLKPNVMMVVDNSGSMLLPTNPSASGCPAGCGTSQNNKCPASCPTRITELKSAMSSFLQSSATVARLGLTIFPVPEPSGTTQCRQPSDINVQMPAPTPTDQGTDATLTAVAQQISTYIAGLNPAGGTPTGATLEFVGGYGGINDASDSREDFVLLLTDGLPNCNDANPNSLCSCGASCSDVQKSACTCTTANCSNSLCAQGCLDQDGTVQKIKELRQKNIRTAVVGFGADLVSGPGPIALNAMARAGDFRPTYFQASNEAELAAALKAISDAINNKPCEFVLAAVPSDARYLSVVVDNQSVAASDATYQFDPSTNKVTFTETGAICQKLLASTSQHPVNVEFRIVERF